MKRITYSKNIFLPVTNLCRNRCQYCSFRRNLDEAHLIRRSAAQQLLEEGRDHGCSEALFTLGERPEEVEGFHLMLAGEGREDLLGYLVELCELAIEHDLLPHTNAGLLSEVDLATLQPYNASMGLMLESCATLDAHEQSPGKNPELRLKHIARAGRLHIPFTTGILVGIGESWQDRIQSIQAISRLHDEHGHIQEVIVQPFDPKPGTAMSTHPRPEREDLVRTVRLARELLPREVAVQVPPNLADPLPLIEAGADDLGGISPITRDEINPNSSWPREEELKRSLFAYELKERLPVYPRFIRRGWHGSKTRRLTAALASEDGLRRKSISSREWW